MTRADLKEAFVERLFWIAGLEELEPDAVAAVGRLTWSDDQPPPSRRGRVLCFEYAGLVEEPFAAVVLSWQPDARTGRVELTPSRLVVFTRSDFDAAMVELGAAPGVVGVDPKVAPGPLRFGGSAPFSGAHTSRLTYTVRAGRLHVAFENLVLRRAEITP